MKATVEERKKAASQKRQAQAHTSLTKMRGKVQHAAQHHVYSTTQVSTQVSRNRSVLEKLQQRGLSTDGTIEELNALLMAAEAASITPPKSSIVLKLEARGLSTEGSNREQFDRLMQATSQEKLRLKREQQQRR